MRRLRDHRTRSVHRLYLSQSSRKRSSICEIRELGMVGAGIRSGCSRRRGNRRSRPPGSSSTSSLMKVATLWLERTVHSHFFTPNTSSCTWIFMFCLTVTWHDSRSPSAASRLVMCESSVGRISPPPSITCHPALGAGAAATAGGGDEQVVVRQSRQQLRADRHMDVLFVVDQDLDVTRGDQFRLGAQNHENQGDHDQR